MELIYSHESTDLSPEQSDRLSIDYLHFAGALTLADGVRPYVGAGIGFTRLAAYDSTTRPSLALALGVQPRLSDSIALRAEVRGYGTFINDDSVFICNPTLCNLKVQGEMLTQIPGQYRHHGPLLALFPHGNKQKASSLDEAFWSSR